MRIAIIDTGVEFRHPHVLRPRVGCSVRSTRTGTELVTGDVDDTSGHGTCIAALILSLAPEAEIDAIRAVAANLRARGDDLVAAIEVAVRRGADIINVSVGTPDLRCAYRMQHAVREANAAGARIVAAVPEGGRRILPAGLSDVVAVGAAPPGTKGILRRKDGFPPFLAPGDARPFEGQRANFHGPSLAAAFVSAHLARGEPLP